jgi:hypothetical protein
MLYSTTHAVETNFGEIKQLYLETEKRVMVNRSYYLVDQNDAQYDVNLGMTMQLPYTFYYTKRVESIVDSSQFRFVGLRFETGFTLFKHIDVYYQHFSGHALDSQYEDNFPQDNKIGIRWHLVGGRR